MVPTFALRVAAADTGTEQDSEKKAFAAAEQDAAEESATASTGVYIIRMYMGRVCACVRLSVDIKDACV